MTIGRGPPDFLRGGQTNKRAAKQNGRPHEPPVLVQLLARTPVPAGFENDETQTVHAVRAFRYVERFDQNTFGVNEKSVSPGKILWS